MPSKTTFDDWAEYKRLVLAELERLNQAVEKLREQSIEADRSIERMCHAVRDELISLQNTMSSDISLGYKQADQEVIKKLKSVENNFDTFRNQFHKDDKASSSWGFWAAIVGMVTSIIVAIASLIVSLL